MSRPRTFVELLIDAEEDEYVRAVLVGILRETDRSARVGPELGTRGVAEGESFPRQPLDVREVHATDASSAG